MTDAPGIELLISTPNMPDQVGFHNGGDDEDDGGAFGIDEIGVRSAALEFALETAKLDKNITDAWMKLTDITSIVVETAKIYEDYLLGTDIPK